MANKVLVRLKNGECCARDLPAPKNTGLLIGAAVGAGCPNLPADVKAIQAALNNVPPDAGGPNPKLAVNGLPGGGLELAIAAFQQFVFGWKNSRVEPDSLTFAALVAFQPGSNGVSHAKKPRSPDTVPLVYSTLPAAMGLIRGALRHIGSCQNLLNGRASLFREVAERRYTTLNAFFHLDKLPRNQALSALARMQTIFQRMETAIGHSNQSTEIGTGIFQPDPQDQRDVYAFTFLGGYPRRSGGKPMMSKADNYQGPNLRQGTIYICAGLDGQPGEITAYTTVHELAHWVGPEINRPDTIMDFSYRFKPDFYTLPAEIALRTADSYAMFAVAASDRALVEKDDIYLPPMIVRRPAGK
jgi:hypothetical protein